MPAFMAPTSLSGVLSKVQGFVCSVSPWWVLSNCAFGLMGCLAALGSLMGSRKVVIL